MELRREIDREHYDKINARHPIQGPGDPVVEAKRRADMNARAKLDMESMDRSNAKPVEGSVMHQRRASLTPGSEGLKIK